ncbi:toll/interleukin-1 receptor domain-containing protein [Streptomyces sp. NPDC002730]|uniref:toll/interleukin-1 receptor domain-containing protein n=1 Tax=Streptomyces sp. NPDC002730 TaxID=3364662 RepID=UPI0036A09AAA
MASGELGGQNPNDETPRLPEAFISYSQTDRDAVLRVAGSLHRLGLKVWLDSKELIAGDSIVEQLGRALERVDLYLVFLSRASLASAWVQHELNTALTMELRGGRPKVVPILLEKVDLPGSLISRLYIDASRSLEDAIEPIRRAISASGLPVEEIAKPGEEDREVWLASARFSLYADTVKEYGGLSADDSKREVKAEASTLLSQLRKKANGILLNFIPISAMSFDNPAFAFPNGQLSEAVVDRGGELVGSIGMRAILDVDVVNPDPELLERLVATTLKKTTLLKIGYQFTINPPIHNLPQKALEKLRNRYPILGWDPAAGAEVALNDATELTVMATPGSVGLQLGTTYSFQLADRVKEFDARDFLAWLLS